MSQSAYVQYWWVVQNKDPGWERTNNCLVASQNPSLHSHANLTLLKIGDIVIHYNTDYGIWTTSRVIKECESFFDRRTKINSYRVGVHHRDLDPGLPFGEIPFEVKQSEIEHGPFDLDGHAKRGNYLNPVKEPFVRWLREKSPEIDKAIKELEEYSDL